MTRALLSMRVDVEPRHGERRDGLSQEWLAWLGAQGIDPFPVPNGVADAGRYFDAVNPAILILTGGNDVGLRAGAGNADAPERDATECALVAAAIERGVPILGVCRGFQLLNVHFGGRLAAVASCADDPTAHVARTHPVALGGVFVELAGGPTIQVNSFHNQAVTAGLLADGLVAFASTPDGRIVEGFVHASRPILGIQWHPERPSPSSSFDRTLCGHLLSLGAFWQRKHP